MRQAQGAQQLIKNAFLELYEEHPLKEITVERLAQKAGYSRAAFYRYYHSSAEVLGDLENDALPAQQSRYIVDHRENITSRIFIELYLDYFKQMQEPLRIMLSRDERGDFYQKLAGTIFPAFYAYLEHAHNLPPEDLDRMTAYLVESKMNQLESWSHKPDRPLDEYMRMPLETIEKEFWQN